MISILFTWFPQKSTSARTPTFDCCSSTWVPGEKAENRRTMWFDGSTRPARVSHLSHLSLKCAGFPGRWKYATRYRTHYWPCTKELRPFRSILVEEQRNRGSSPSCMKWVLWLRKTLILMKINRYFSASQVPTCYTHRFHSQRFLSFRPWVSISSPLFCGSKTGASIVLRTNYDKISEHI